MCVPIVLNVYKQKTPRMCERPYTDTYPPIKRGMPPYFGWVEAIKQVGILSLFIFEFSHRDPPKPVSETNKHNKV